MLRGSSSWRIQFSKDPAIEGGSGTQRMQFLEDPAVSKSNSGSTWLLEEDPVLSLLTLSQPRGWAAPCLELLSAAALRPEPPAWEGAPGRAVLLPGRPARIWLLLPTPSPAPRGWPRRRWLYRLREDEEGEEGDGLALQEHLGASTEPTGFPTGNTC